MKSNFKAQDGVILIEALVGMLIFLIGIIAVSLLLIYEHWLVKPNDLTRVNQAFFQVNAIVSVGLFLLVLWEVTSNH